MDASALGHHQPFCVRDRGAAPGLCKSGALTRTALTLRARLVEPALPSSIPSPTHLVVEVTSQIHQLVSSQHRPDFPALRPLQGSLPVPSHASHFSQPLGIVLIRLVDAHSMTPRELAGECWQSHAVVRLRPLSSLDAQHPCRISIFGPARQLLCSRHHYPPAYGLDAAAKEVIVWQQVMIKRGTDLLLQMTRKRRFCPH
ncbi:hypothetical protein ACVIYL_004750 [Bradyrhizobium sp. USDA 3315]